MKIVINGVDGNFVSLCGRKPLSIKYIFEHVEDYLLGDRHPTEE